jgi:hypothetical protein
MTSADEKRGATSGSDAVVAAAPAEEESADELAEEEAAAAADAGRSYELSWSQTIEANNLSRSAVGNFTSSSQEVSSCLCVKRLRGFVL